MSCESQQLAVLVSITFDAGENIAEPLEYPRAVAVVKDNARAETCNEEKVEELAEIICRANDRCAAALVALMRTLEKSVDAKPLVNKAKHFAFARCVRQTCQAWSTLRPQL